MKFNSIFLLYFDLYSSIDVFDSCIYSISMNITSSIVSNNFSSSWGKESCIGSCTVFHEDQLDFPVAYLETVKGFPSRSIGIPGDVRSVPDGVTWPEICGDSKRFNSIATYCDDENLINGVGYRKRQGYSNKWLSCISRMSLRTSIDLSSNGVCSFSFLCANFKYATKTFNPNIYQLKG